MKKLIIAFIQYYKEVSRRRIRRRFGLFLFCIAVAFVFWILTVLGKNRHFDIQVPIVFINVPFDQALMVDNSRHVSFTVEGSGWFFLKSKIQSLSDTLIIDLNEYEQTREIDLIKKINSIDKITLDKLVIIDVSPAKLKFKFEKKNTKKVPIVLNSKIQFSKQFGLKNDIRISPDSVVISGPQEDIQSINKWEVNPVNIIDIADDQNLSLSLKPAQNSNVLLANNKVDVYIPVEKYNTKRILVPIHIKAMAPYAKIAIYPQKAELTFLVGISKYKSINENAFRVIAVQEKKSRNKLKLKMDHVPMGIQNLAIAPHFVDYLIYNK
jgi:hypothetical protein